MNEAKRILRQVATELLLPKAGPLTAAEIEDLAVRLLRAHQLLENHRCDEHREAA